MELVNSSMECFVVTNNFCQAEEFAATLWPPWRSRAAGSRGFMMSQLAWYKPNKSGVMIKLVNKSIFGTIGNNRAMDLDCSPSTSMDAGCSQQLQWSLRSGCKLSLTPPSKDERRSYHVRFSVGRLAYGIVLDLGHGSKGSKENLNDPVTVNLSFILGPVEVVRS